ncbi:MAG TPA: hypothetical protein VGD55_04655, partial [Acidothermaceae bacterium]
MHLHPRIPRPRSIAAVAISIGLGSVASFALVTDASAHANIVHGTSVCNQTDGTYTITWTIANDYNLSDTVSKVSDTGGGTLSGLPATIAASPHTPYNTATATQTGVPGTATTATLTINGLWSDGYHQQDGASVTLGGNCVIPPTRTTTAAATFTDATCAAATGSYTIPSSTSADYFVAINGGASAAAAAGTVSEPAGTAIVVTAHAKTGFVLTGTTNWSHTIAAATGCTTSPPPSSPPPSSPPPVVHPATIAPAVPTITQGVCVSGKQTSAFFTIPGITGVTYLANGVSVAAGNHNVAYGSTTTVTAAALAGYSFPAGTTTSWTLVANAALPSCAAAPTAVLGITFNNPPATPPVKSPPSAVLPFT